MTAIVKFKTVAEQFWPKVDKSGDCWLWTAARRAHGYGQLNVAGKISKAHRVAWELANGPIPHGMCVLHRCDNPPCVRPDHLFLGTQADNNADKVAKNRHNTPARIAAMPRGDSHYSRREPWRLARGDANGARTKPESRLRGDAHPFRKNPSCVPRGTAHGNAKLSEADVIAIRRLYAAGGTSQRALAAQFGVTQRIVLGVVHRRIWKHVP